MSGFSLYSRMREHGTLAEKAGDVPDARFALPYTSMRMGRDLWSAFLDDLEAKRSISLSPKAVWS